MENHQTFLECSNNPPKNISCIVNLFPVISWLMGYLSKSVDKLHVIYLRIKIQLLSF